MRRYIIIFSMLLLVIACKKKDDPEPIPIPDDPTAAILIFPYENSECNVGTDVTLTESTVLFEWESALFTDDYELTVKNLISGVAESYSTVNLEYSVVLLRATPYQWYVISKSDAVDTTVGSEVWRFYNAGDAIQFHIPFPAEIISPAMSEIITTSATEISLDWNGVDLDDDIVGYDVYFGSVDPPSLFASNVQESILNGVPISQNTVYFWKIITTDSRANSSDSGIAQFKIN